MAFASKFMHQPLAGLLLIAVLAACGCGDASATSGSASPDVQDTTRPTANVPADSSPASTQNQDADNSAAVQEVSLVSADAKKLAEVIAEHKGKVVLVDFWATWCGPCVEKFPKIIEIHNKLSEKGVVVVTVSMDAPDNQQPVKDFLEQNKATSVNLHSSLELGDAFEAFDLSAGVPEYRVYDKQGELDTVFKVDPTAARPYTVEDIEAKLQELLAKEVD